MRICNDFASRGHSTPIAADFSNYAADFRSKNEKIIPNHTGQYLKIPSPSNPHNTRVESVWDGTFAQALEDQFPTAASRLKARKGCRSCMFWGGDYLILQVMGHSKSKTIVEEHTVSIGREHWAMEVIFSHAFSFAKTCMITCNA